MQVPVPKATKPNCCFSVLAPWLLALGFVGAGAFPAVRLPLLVQAADADSLPPAHGDVLLHKAGQHACRESTHTGLECCDYPCQRAALPLSLESHQWAPPGTIKAEICGSPD